MNANGNAPGVLCAGILVADLFVPPLPRLPDAGALCATDDFLLDTGGCAANVGVTLARLGVATSVAGCVGSDAFGEFVIGDLRKKGVETSAVRRSTAAGTSKTVILTVIGEDRRFIHTFGANAEFRAEEVDPSVLSPGGVLYVGGYLVMPGVEAGPLAALFAGARARGIRTVLDVVVPTGAGAVAWESLGPVLPEVDYFLPNDEEAAALTGETDPKRQAERMLDAGCGAVVVTQGARGTLLVDGNQVVQAPADSVCFVDGSGAGDAFAGGFILGLIEGWPVADAVRFAGAVGASACTKLGCTTGVFTRAEAEAFVAANPMSVVTNARERVRGAS